jgi:hypothetical protein
MEVIKMTNSNINNDWIHKARVDTSEKTKHMSSEEFREYFSKRCKYFTKNMVLQ